ncbi:class I tRNA ligase family protein, partial [Cribrihabitans sp. XS_ASV171]
LHPFMPFVTEELWDLPARRDAMLVTTDWPTYSSAELIDSKADDEMNWVIALIENTRSARQQMRVPAGLYVPMIVTEIDAQGQAAWDRNETLIKRLARIDSLTDVDTPPKGTISISAPGASFGLPLADIIDIGAEKERLEKAKTKLSKELGGLRGRLNNPKFVESAPEEVVEEARENLAAREEEESRINEALARLAEIA